MYTFGVKPQKHMKKIILSIAAITVFALLSIESKAQVLAVATNGPTVVSYYCVTPYTPCVPTSLTVTGVTPGRLSVMDACGNNYIMCGYTHNLVLGNVITYISSTQYSGKSGTIYTIQL